MREKVMKLKLVFSFFFLLLHSLVHAIPDGGSCADESFKFPLSAKGEDIIDTTKMVRVLKEDASLYKAETGSTQVRSLKFDEKFKPLKKQGQRIQVGNQHTESPEGWIEKHDLLCNFIPLSSTGGLPRKVFIKIPTAALADYFIPSYPSPEEPIYGDKNKIIVRISRFKNYFVFAEDLEHQRFLLSPVYNLAQTESKPLTGWVDINNLIEWKTNLGIRPKEESGHLQGYLSIEDSGKPLDDRTTGVELNGGKEWYKYPLHIPLLEVIDKHYKVAASGMGMSAFEPYDSGLSTLNDIDLFFVIDGTASMEPFIAAARQTVENIIERLTKKLTTETEEKKFGLDPSLREASFRCGFLIYRDHYADKDKRCKEGLCEDKGLSATDCKTRNLSSCEEVIEALSNVKVTANDNDDYEELLFNGLTKSISLMVSCPEREKLLIVMGDHGDRETTLSQGVIDNLKNSKVRPFFLQTSSNQYNVKSSEKYRVAYDKFRVQTQDILKRMGLEEIENSFMSLSKNETPDKIANSLAADFLNRNISPAILTEINMMLEAGHSVEEAVNKYRKKESFENGENGLQNDMSVLFWERVEKTACDGMPEQCNKAVDHRVNEFFIPINEEKIEEELLLLERHISDWRKLLQPLITHSYRDISSSKKREILQKLILEGIQRVLGEPTITATDTRTLEEIIMHAKIALPVRPQSPLFQYSPYDFDSSNDNKVSDCEVDRILEWIKSVDSILEKIVSYPHLKVPVSLVEYGKSDCRLSSKGQRIKRVLFRDEREPLGSDDTYRYGHAFPGAFVTIYWIPLEYLP
jgi:hypothetical protein